MATGEMTAVRLVSALLLLVAVALPAPAGAVGGSAVASGEPHGFALPLTRASAGPDVTRPAVMDAAAAQVATPYAGSPLRPRGSVAPLRRSGAAAATAAARPAGRRPPPRRGVRVAHARSPGG